ncbi:MAG: acyl transferase [Bacteroidetes bacterium]|nr:acyl transferase [Bacteroidota bacterium]
MNTKQLANSIFSVTNETSFTDIALEIFYFQSRQNAVYKEYLNLLNIDPASITRLSQIPFLPVEFFKTHTIVSGNRPIESVFLSSGTIDINRSKHKVCDLTLYEQSFTKGFELFYGKPQQYTFLGLLPSYLDRKDSSLVYMVGNLIHLSDCTDSGFYLRNTDELLNKIIVLEQADQNYILLGVTYALLDLAEKVMKNKFPKLKYAIVMETGGMKGIRKELVKAELHTILKSAFGLTAIHSEYGMTELLSQAYSKENGIFNCPPWMKVMIRDTNDPFRLVQPGQTGGINIIDLANIYSCSFIATQDLGKMHNERSFEVLGRFDNSDLRGCNLLIN